MTDSEKLEKVKTILRKWALDDRAVAVDCLVEIMDALDYDPYLGKENDK